MSGRNRGRQNTNQDDAEEKRLWKEIKSQAAVVDEKVVCTSLSVLTVVFSPLALCEALAFTHITPLSSTSLAPIGLFKLQKFTFRSYPGPRTCDPAERIRSHLQSMNKLAN
jgi:hypothetical protein